MENQNIKNYQFLIGFSLVLIGILMFSFFSVPVRYFGFAFIIGAAVYFINIYPTKLSGDNSAKFKSRTREQILRHQHKTK